MRSFTRDLDESLALEIRAAALNAIMKSIRRFFSELFDEESVWVGWSVYWRVMLLTFLITFPLNAIAVGEELAFAVGILSGLVVMAILGSVVNRVALYRRTTYTWVEIMTIGWSTFWRYLLLGGAGLLPLMAISILVASAFGSEWIALFFIPFAVLWLSACMGWAVGKVKRFIDSRGGSGMDGLA